MKKRAWGKMVKFGNLKNGDAFLRGKEILMKMEAVIDRSGDTWNAVSAENGERYCYCDKSKVEFINVLMTIE